MARLYSNENFPQPVVERLRELGHDVTTVLETGHAGASWPDDQVLAYAVAEQRTLLTLNRRHFVQRHMKSSQHSGIIVCTSDRDFIGHAERIHEAIIAAGDLTGVLLRVNRPHKP
jgi:hypothetical protein